MHFKIDTQVLVIAWLHFSESLSVCFLHAETLVQVPRCFCHWFAGAIARHGDWKSGRTCICFASNFIALRDCMTMLHVAGSVGDMNILARDLNSGLLPKAARARLSAAQAW